LKVLSTPTRIVNIDCSKNYGSVDLLFSRSDSANGGLGS
jgi:hypothetical protein